MVNAHVAHDCILGSDIILANAATLAGHVVIEDHATIGAYSGVHQFCTVGIHGYVGGYTVVTKDVLPILETGEAPEYEELRSQYDRSRAQRLSRSRSRTLRWCSASCSNPR